MLSPDSHLKRAGEAVGIHFNMDRKMYPTIRAHALLEHVKKQDNEKSNQLMELLYDQYFVKGANINDEATLVSVAGEIGVSSEDVHTALSNKEGRDDIVRKDMSVKQRGVSGVPFFILGDDEDITFSGAQPAEFIAQKLKEAASS